MSFNSHLFLLGFLPITLVVLQVLLRLRQPDAAKIWLILASFAFYATGDRNHFPLFILSIAFNYGIGKLFHSAAAQFNQKNRLYLLTAGLFWNIGLLCYFKYWVLVLPLGISYFTFTQLMFLVDSYSGLVEKPYRFLDYVLFAAFFPYQLAGPLVKHEEMIPQFEQNIPIPRIPDVLFGCILFAIGAFKKVVVADTLAGTVNPIFQLVNQGHWLTPISAWTGALAFTLQLYFDFSGYSDMAVGLGKLFGLKLPYNFNSPYKADTIIEFWKRWHMSLTRFLTSYIYNPIVLHVTRYRKKMGQSTMRPGAEDLSGFLTLVAIPTLITMFIAGVWHGAGWTFVCFGLLHGSYLCINHGWHILRRKGFLKGLSLPRFVGCLVTFSAVMLSFIFFRSADLFSAKRLLWGLVGQHAELMSSVAIPHATFLLIAILLAAVWTLPNSQQLCVMALTPAPVDPKSPAPQPS